MPRQLLRPKNAWYFYTDIVTHYFVTLFSNTQARQFFFTFKFLLKHRYLTAAKFKDLAKFVSFAEIFFYYSFQIHCSYLLSKILRVLVQAKRWVACRWLIKLRVHSLEIKELISIICSEENNLTSFVLSLLLLNLYRHWVAIAGFFASFPEEKVTSNPGYQNQIFQRCRHGSVPTSRFWRQFSAITVVFFIHYAFVEKKIRHSICA